jgi:hypothetical protein
MKKYKKNITRFLTHGLKVRFSDFRKKSSPELILILKINLLSPGSFKGIDCPCKNFYRI